MKESAKIRFPVQSRVVLPLPLVNSSQTLAKADTGRKAGPERAAADAPIRDVAYSTETYRRLVAIASLRLSFCLKDASKPLTTAAARSSAVP